jgi:cell division protein FtsB
VSRARPALRPAAPAGERARPPLGLTPRGVVLFLVLFALAATAVYPLRQYVTQRDRIERLQAKQRALDAENDRLARERQRLQDPAYVEELAKRDFHVVAPGEEQWVVTGTPPTGPPATVAPARRPPRQPLYERAWKWLTGWFH